MSKKPRENLGIPRPVRLFKKDEEDTAQLARDFQLTEQEVIRRLVAVGLQRMKARDNDANELMKRPSEEVPTTFVAKSPKAPRK